MLTLLIATNRGLYPMTGAGMGLYHLLAQCLQEQTYTDYDMVVVDEHNPLPRHELTHFLGNRVRFFRPRETPWSRLGAFASCRARNTGLVHARGSVVAAIDDCYSFGPGYLARIAELANDGIYTASMLRQADNSVAYPVDAPGPVPAERYCGGIISYPLDAAIAVNGMDERLDGGSGGDIDFFDRLRAVGVRFVHDPEVAVVGHNHYGRKTKHPRCWRLGWDLSLKRRARTVRANEAWTAEELAAWDGCGRPATCRLTGSACDYRDAEPPEVRAIRMDHETRPGFDLAAERASAMRGCDA